MKNRNKKISIAFIIKNNAAKADHQFHQIKPTKNHHLLPKKDLLSMIKMEIYTKENGKII